MNSKKKHYRSRAVVSSLRSSLKRKKASPSSPVGGTPTRSRKKTAAAAIPSSIRRRLSIDAAIPSNIRRRLSIDLDQAKFRLSVDTAAAVVILKKPKQSKGLKQNKDSIV